MGVGAAIATGAAVGPAALSSPTFPFFLQAITREFDWPVAMVTGAFGLSVLLAPIILPLSGMLVDRFGARAVVLPAMAVYGIATLLFAFVQASPWQLAALFLMLGAGGLSTMTPLLKAVTVTFPERRGLALALLIGGSAAASGAIAAVSVQALIAAWGWRTAYLAMAATIMLVALPVLWAFFRASSDVHDSDRSGEAETQSGDTVGQALKTRAFWLALYALAINAFVLMAYRQHVVLILGEQGFDASFAAIATSTLLLASLLGQIVAGCSADRWDRPSVLLPFFLFPLLGLMLIFNAGAGAAVVLIGALLLGLGSGGEYCLSPFLTGRYFGLRTFGRIQGIKLAVVTVATGAAGTITAVLRSQGNSYADLGWVASAFLVAGFVAILLLPQYPAAHRTGHAND